MSKRTEAPGALAHANGDCTERWRVRLSEEQAERFTAFAVTNAINGDSLSFAEAWGARRVGTVYCRACHAKAPATYALIEAAHMQNAMAFAADVDGHGDLWIAEAMQRSIVGEYGKAPVRRDPVLMLRLRPDDGEEPDTDDQRGWL
jgi:hypothetical protein